MELEVKQKPLVLYAKNEINTVPLKRLSKTEIDLFFYLCFALNEKESQKITLTYREIKKILDFKPNDINRLTKLIVRTHKKLLEVNFTIKEENEIISFPIFYEFKTNVIEKKITIQVHPRFQHVLNNFKFGGNFTKINLLEIISLKLDYAKKLYPILKQFEKTGQVYLRELNEWRNVLCVPQAYNYDLLNRKILTPIVKELSKFFPNLKLIKKNTGRKITHIGFTFDPLKIEKKQILIYDLEKENKKNISTDTNKPLIYNDDVIVWD